MNKWIGVLVGAGLAMGTGMAEERVPAGRAVAALEPGMTWKVESLPSGRKILASPDRGETQGSRAAGSGAATLVEENVIGNGFRLQKRMLGPLAPQTRLFQKDRCFVLLPDGRSYSIDFPDPEVPNEWVDSRHLREFDWVETRWRMETRLVDGVECDVYRRPWPGGGASASAEEPGESEWVAIGRADRFPRRWESPGRTYRYVVLPRVSPPELPPGAVAAARELEERLERQAKRYRIPQ